MNRRRTKKKDNYNIQLFFEKNFKKFLIDF